MFKYLTQFLISKIRNSTISVTLSIICGIAVVKVVPQ